MHKMNVILTCGIPAVSTSLCTIVDHEVFEERAVACCQVAPASLSPVGTAREDGEGEKWTGTA